MVLFNPWATVGQVVDEEPQEHVFRPSLNNSSYMTRITR